MFQLHKVNFLSLRAVDFFFFNHSDYDFLNYGGTLDIGVKTVLSVQVYILIMHKGGVRNLSIVQTDW